MLRMFGWLDRIIYRLAVRRYSDFARMVIEHVLQLSPPNDVSRRIAATLLIDQVTADQFVKIIRMVASMKGDRYWSCWALRVVLESWGKKLDVFDACRVWSEWVEEKNFERPMTLCS